MLWCLFLFTLCRVNLIEYTRLLKVLFHLVASEPLYLGAILALVEGHE
jgi:hypothetical protein